MAINNSNLVSANQNAIPGTSQRVVWADLVRFLAIFIIVLRHICPAFYDSEKTSDILFVNIFVAMTEWCLPVLVMISGAFILNPKKKFSIKTFYKKNVLRLFTALCFWSIIYGVYSVCTHPNSSWTLFSIIGPIFYKRLPWYHLWFMYMIIGLYLVVPFLRLCVQYSSRKYLEYFLLLFFAVNTIEFWNEFMPELNFSIPVITSYLGYFVAGYYFFNYDISKKVRHVIYSLCFLSVAFIVMLHLRTGQCPRTYINATNNPFVIILSIGAFLSFKYSNLNFKHVGLIKELSKLSFGVYLVHDLFIQFIQFDFFSNSPFVIIPLKGLAVICCSLLVSFAINKIPVAGKYIS